MNVIKCAAVGAMLAISSSAAADVVLINAFEVPAGQRDAMVAAWDEARAFLAEQPGYIDTALHAALSPDARFQLVNIARWESADAFAAALRAMTRAGVFALPEGAVMNPALYEVIRTD